MQPFAFRFAVLAAALSASGFAHAQFSQCRQFFPNGEPPQVQAERARELCFDAFAVLHSGATKTPVFVAERLTRAQLMDALDEQRTDKFYAEARLPSADRAQLSDYKGSGYDRGHMAPAGDMPTPAAMSQSFSLANMVPQDRALNRGVWADIERDTRAYVKRTGGPVYVFTGPFYERGKPAAKAGEVSVPTHVFKLVYDARSGHSWAHFLENQDVPARKPLSYADFVKRTGLELLPKSASKN